MMLKDEKLKVGFEEQPGEVAVARTDKLMKSRILKNKCSRLIQWVINSAEIIHIAENKLSITSRELLSMSPFKAQMNNQLWTQK